MEKFRVAFVGVGSIAKRHIKNLHEICYDMNMEIEVHAFRRENVLVDGVDLIHPIEDDKMSDFDVIFITNPTEYHLNTLRQFHNKGKHFFIEKPVVSIDQIQGAEQFVLKNESIYYVACPLRYNAVIQWVKNNVDPFDVISVRSISSSFLPNWRPGQDYRNTYSAHKRMGGGVSIDLIHEWDYLTYIFGWPTHLKSFIGKKSDLEIDSDDYAIYIAEYGDKIIELHLDYFGINTIREIQLITKKGTIVGDIFRNKVYFMNNDKTLSFNEERDDYQKRELIHFFNMCKGSIEKEDGYHHGLDVLKLTQGGII